MRCGWLVVLGLAVSCHATKPLTAPVVEEGRSVLFIGERDGAAIFAYAFDLDDQGRAPYPAPASQPGDLWWVLGLGCPLETLTLEPGAIILTPPADALETSPIPAPLNIQKLEPHRLGAWTTATDASAAVQSTLRRLPLSEDFPCELVKPEFAPQFIEFELPTNELYDTTFAAEIGANEVFVTTIQSNEIPVVASSTTGHAAFVFNLETGIAEPVEIGGQPIVAGFQDEDGELWLLGTDAVLRGRVATGFAVAFSLGAVAPIRRGHITGRGAGSSIELSITTSEYDGSLSEVVRTWLHYDGTALEMLTTDTRSDVLPTSVFVGPGHVLAINTLSDPPTIRELRDGQVTDMQPIREGRPVEINFVPGLGIVLRYRDATYRFVDGAFVPEAEALPWIQQSLATDFGVIVAGAPIFGYSGRSGSAPIAMAQRLDWTGVCVYGSFSAGGVSRLSIPLSRPKPTVVSLDFTFNPASIRATVITLEGGPKPCAAR